MRIYLLTIVVIFIDQSTKMWITNNLGILESFDILGSFLRFTHVKNPGIAFGISVGGYTMLVTCLSIVATFFIMYLHWQERKNHPIIVNSLALILGGAIGNLIDRSYVFISDPYSGVVDFIDVGVGGLRWYTFNIADSAVTIGVLLYLLYSLLMIKPELVEQND